MIDAAHRSLALALVLVATAACAGAGGDAPLDFPLDGAGGKTDTFGRRLAGVASDYPASDLDEAILVADARRRRQVAWATVEKVLADVPLLGLADSAGEHPEIELPDGEVPRVPRFQTWYGIDDLKRMYQALYQGLGAGGRRGRVAFTDEEIAGAVRDNALALDRSSRWPLDRYLKYVKELGVCPAEMPADDCARLVQQKIGGATSGNSRILYSPGTAVHILGSYGDIVDCLQKLDTVGLDAAPPSDDDFTLCFAGEMPSDAVLVKAQWARAEFGKELPVFDTDADTLAARLGGTADWGDQGDRTADPGPDRIFTIRLRSGDVYRLVGLHIMTKELRHWQWVTLWWSDRPDTDFGADRPAALAATANPVFANYKMCVVDGYTEEDADPAAGFADTPSLAAALRAASSGAGAPSWCSNPYLEHGRGNARTNCIGCHQHGGSTVVVDKDGDGTLDPLDTADVFGDELHFPDTGRRRIRDLFPADYLYSFNRVDDFAHMIAGEVGFFESSDRDAVRPRIEHVLSLDGDAAAGADSFAGTCAACHGAGGEGSDWAPNLFERVPGRADDSIVQTLIQGRGGMPSWGDRFDDQQLADLLAHLRGRFGGGD